MARGSAARRDAAELASSSDDSEEEDVTDASENQVPHTYTASSGCPAAILTAAFGLNVHPGTGHVAFQNWSRLQHENWLWHLCEFAGPAVQDAMCMECHGHALISLPEEILEHPRGSKRSGSFKCAVLNFPLNMVSAAPNSGHF